MKDVHPLGNTLLRTPETFARYHNSHARKDDDGCFICRAVLGEQSHPNWTFWAIIRNDFPYDAVADRHLMLVPKRHVAGSLELSVYERDELADIKEWLDIIGDFDAVIENLPRGRTFAQHYHLHLVQWKRV